MTRSALIFLFALLLLAIPSAFAANCANPVGVEGKSFYNSTYHLYQFCNGTNWIAFNAINPAAGGGGCSNPTAREATVIYSVDHHVLQYCDGTYWQAVGSGGGTCTVSGGSCPAPAPAGSGFFVVTKTTYDGNLGGLAGANASCLTELTTNTGWFGYAQANAAGLLVAAHVKAFLCDGTTCNNLTASKTYYFGNANDSTAGGGSFTTDASGFGPNDSVQWGKGDHFAGMITGLSYRYWTARPPSSATAWNGAVTATSCTGWTTNAAGVNAEYGLYTATTSQRWAYTQQACSSTLSLICFVNP